MMQPDEDDDFFQPAPTTKNNTNQSSKKKNGKKKNSTQQQQQQNFNTFAILSNLDSSITSNSAACSPPSSPLADNNYSQNDDNDDNDENPMTKSLLSSFIIEDYQNKKTVNHNNNNNNKNSSSRSNSSSIQQQQQELEYQSELSDSSPENDSTTYHSIANESTRDSLASSPVSLSSPPHNDDNDENDEEYVVEEEQQHQQQPMTTQKENIDDEQEQDFINQQQQQQEEEEEEEVGELVNPFLSDNDEDDDQEVNNQQSSSPSYAPMYSPLSSLMSAEQQQQQEQQNVNEDHEEEDRVSDHGHVEYESEVIMPVYYNNDDNDNNSDNERDEVDYNEDEENDAYFKQENDYSQDIQEYQPNLALHSIALNEENHRHEEQHQEQEEEEEIQVPAVSPSSNQKRDQSRQAVLDQNENEIEQLLSQEEQELINNNEQAKPSTAPQEYPIVKNQTTLYPTLMSGATPKRANTLYEMKAITHKVVDRDGVPLDHECFKGQWTDQEYFRQLSYKPTEYTFLIDGSTGVATSGQSGSDGATGKAGMSGRRGGYAENGESGSDGEDGSDGLNGANGKHGVNAYPIYVRVDGDEQQLSLSGSYHGMIPLGNPNPDQVGNPSLVYIDACGGDGGQGGNGGRGGNGGNGGNGGPGGEPESHVSANGNEMIGGRGGDGGSGGNGGNGGHGGNGGNGGKGGSILIEATKSELFMFMEVNVLGGKSGKGGEGGKGGVGGKGGSAGHGFLTYEDKMKGVDGRMGTSGTEGLNGRSGVEGAPGNVYYVVLNPDLSVKEQGYKKYTVKVVSYNVRGVDDDGIFEPNDEIMITDIVLENDGHITLPKGCKLSLTRNDMFTPIESGDLLPEIPPNSRITVDFNLRGRINSVPTPTAPGRYNQKLEICTKCHLLGKEFRDSTYGKNIDVTYPIQLGRATHPKAMAPGDVATFKIEVANISTVYYGTKSDGGQPIDYKVTFDERFQLLNHDQKNSMEGSIEKLAPGSAKTIEFSVRLLNSAAFYEQLTWKVELRFRDTLIEFSEIPLRVCPRFNTQEASSSDLLLITHSMITQREYLLYNKIFEGLGLKASFFDSEMYNGISVNSITNKPNEWVGKFVGKPILLPLKNLNDISLLHGGDIVSHFHGNTNDNEDRNESGFVIIGVSKNISQFRENMKQHLFDSMGSGAGVYEISEKKLSDYFIMTAPTVETMNLCLNKTVEDYTKKQPSQVFKAYKTEFAPRKLNMFNLYTHGKGVLKQLPLNKIHRFRLVTNGDETLEHNPLFLSTSRTSTDDDSTFRDSLNRSDFYTEERFFEVLLAIISSLSITKKMHMLMDDHQQYMKCKDWNFIVDETYAGRRNSSSRQMTSSHKRITINDLLAVSLYNDLKTEYFYPDLGLRRAILFCQIAKANASKLRTMNEALYTIWLVMSRMVSHTFWRSLPYFSSLSDKRNSLIALRAELEKVLFDNSSVTNVSLEMKRRAESDAENKDRLKMEDLQKVTVSLLQ